MRFGLTSSKLWAVYGLAILASTLGAAQGLSMDGRSAVEALAFGTLVLALLTHPPIQRAFQALGRGRRVFSIAMVVALCGAHVAKVSAYTFPFVDWRMFGRSAAPGPGQALRFTAVRVDGATERLVLGASISDATVSRLNRMAGNLLEAGDRAQLAKLLKAAATLESSEGDAPVDHVEISRCLIQGELPRAPRCTLVDDIQLRSQPPVQ